MATLTLIPKTYVRFAPGTPDARTAVVLKDGSFFQVKPTRQKFANGDEWSFSFMGAGATLSCGLDAGKLHLEEPRVLETAATPIYTPITPTQQMQDLLNIQDKDGNTSLHLSIGPMSEQYKMARELLEAGADPNIRNKKGETPLYLAIKSHANDTILCLLKHKADPNIKMPNGDYLLHVAANAGGIWYLSRLLEFGANPNVQNGVGMTPLHQKVKNGATFLAKMLLDAGADKTIQDKNGNTAIHYAVMMKNKKAIQMLLAA